MAGIRPASGYGSAVNGLDDKEWARLQTIMLTPKGPSGKGTSKRIKIALWGGPRLEGGVCAAADVPQMAVEGMHSA